MTNQQESQQQQQDQTSATTCTPETMAASPLVVAAAEEINKSVRFGACEERVMPALPKGIKRKDLFYTFKELQALKEANTQAKRLSEEQQQNGEGGITNNKGGKNSNNKKRVGILGSVNNRSSKDCCVRGLEHTLRTAERDRHIKTFVRSVLETHQEQKQYGIQDDYELFLVASANSKKDRIKAKRMGAQDAREAATICYGWKMTVDNSNDDTIRTDTSSTESFSWSSFMSSSSSTSCSLFDLSSSSSSSSFRRRRNSGNSNIRLQQRHQGLLRKKYRIFQFFQFQKSNTTSSIKEEGITTN